MGLKIYTLPSPNILIFTKTFVEKRSEKINLLGTEKSFDWAMLAERE